MELPDDIARLKHRIDTAADAHSIGRFGIFSRHFRRILHEKHSKSFKYHGNLYFFVHERVKIVNFVSVVNLKFCKKGFRILEALIVDIDVDRKVADSMNQINANRCDLFQFNIS